MSQGKNPRDILIAPVVSEKSYGLLDEGKYTFIVDPRSNKTEIKIAVEEIFNVKVDSVHTMNRPGKARRTRFGLGKRIEPRWLRPTWTDGPGLVKLAQDEIAEARRNAPSRPVILNAMFHNVEVIPDASPYADSESGAVRILERLRSLLAFAKRESISVIGLGDVPEILGT